MNAEDPISPTKLNEDVIKKRVNADEFENRRKFGTMDLSHGLEVAKMKAKFHNMD